MDSGWAVVLGAAIALVGSAIVPWARDAVTDRRTRELDRQKALANASEEVVRLAAWRFEPIANLNWQHETSKRGLALTRLGLLLNRGEVEIQELVERAFTSLAGEDGQFRAGVYLRMASRLREWHRGEISARDAWDTFAAEVDAEERERDARVK